MSSMKLFIGFTVFFCINNLSIIKVLLFEYFALSFLLNIYVSARNVYEVYRYISDMCVITSPIITP